MSDELQYLPKLTPVANPLNLVYELLCHSLTSSQTNMLLLPVLSV
jgi:hypothetical protein